ncbi:MAG: T9SS type A sorting domain-containing protein [Ignavibacteriales bacterium]|nr:T9SS type A sorting domain-containing protein [Ignavibacteriales bacterium]
MKKIISTIVLFLCFIASDLFAQTTEWYYEYNLGSSDEQGKDIIYGDDGNIYAAGYTDNSATNYNIVLIGLRKDGTQRWVYTYDGVYSGSNDGVNRIIYGSNDKIYLAGYTQIEEDGNKFLVLCIDTSGVKEWEYVFTDVSGTYGQANDLVRGDDGNIYACGRVDYDFFAVSINNFGQQNWTYRVNGDCGYSLCDDEAVGIEYRDTDSIYVAGYLNRAAPNGKDIYVVSLNHLGNENWSYYYNSPENGGDVSVDLIAGTDGHLYLAGTEGCLGANEGDIIVLSINSSGTERWNYIYDGPGPKPYWSETCYRLIHGEEGNLYIAGRDGGVEDADLDFIVISLSSDGNFRWVHRYNGVYINYYDMAFALTQTPDGNIHAAGYYVGLISEFGMTSIHGGTGRDLWIYRYAGQAYGGDIAYGITSDDEGYIYVTGYDWEPGPEKDLVVVKLNPPRNSDGWYNFADYLKVGTQWYYSESEANSIEKTNDGKYIVTGHMGGQGSWVTRNLFLMKVDEACDTIWTRMVGGNSEEEVGYSVIETNDHGFVATGFTKSYGAGGKDVYLIKTDADGNLQWGKCYGGASDDEGYSVIQTNDLGFLIAARTSSYGQGGDIWIIKTNASGDTLWTQLIGGTKSDQVNKIIETSSNDYLIVGSFRLTDNSYDMYLIRIDANGDTLWTKKYDRNNRWDVGYDAVEVESGNFIIAGYLDSRPALLKIDMQGDTLFTKTYGAEDPSGFVSLSRTTDGNFFVLKPDDYSGVPYILVYKVDADGNEIRQDSTGISKTYSAYYTGGSNDLVSIGADDYLTVGEGKVAGDAMSMWNAIITRKGGALTAITEVKDDEIFSGQPTDYLLYQNYPNPFNPVTTIRFSIPVSGNVTLKIYDILGREVKTLLREYKSTGIYEVSFDGGGLASGIYFYQLSAVSGADYFVQTKKMLLLK